MYSSTLGNEPGVIRDTSLGCEIPASASPCAHCGESASDSGEKRGSVLKTAFKCAGAENLLLALTALLLLDGERCSDTDSAVLMLLLLLFC